MSKVIEAVGFAAIGTTLLVTGLFTYLELGNIYYEMNVNGKDIHDITIDHFENAERGWDSL